MMDKQIGGIVKKSNESARVPYIQTIADEDLADYPGNGEDLADTADLENSMKEIGFTDPIEVAKAGDGKYVILSGHRRRAAAVRSGMAEFPCVVLPFANDGDMRNYVLLANSHRDSSKDPLLYCKRYKMHEAYLSAAGFKGGKVEEIAKRLGISAPQAERYKRFNSVIAPVWELVRKESVGMSSVLPMASLPEGDQEAVYRAFLKLLETRGRINRETCERVIKEFSDGKNAGNAIKKMGGESLSRRVEEDAGGLPAGGEAIAAEVCEGAAGADGTDGGTGFFVGLGDEGSAGGETGAEGGGGAGETENQETGGSSEETRQIGRGAKLDRSLRRITGILRQGYKFPDDESANGAIETMAEAIIALYAEMGNLAGRYGAGESVKACRKHILDNIL